MIAAIDPSPKSQSSYKSTASSRSSVLERARAYSQKLEDGQATRERSQSPHSARSPNHSGNRPMTRERAYQSVENENNYTRTSPAAAMNGGYNEAPQQRASPARSQKSLRSRGDRHPNDDYGGGENPVVSPELLVDALSGHEDGLLAIAERLMEHYDHGYDVMGEAIIDAFADVQKLFQHVVEAAHMEGAAFEASRREEEDRMGKQDDVLLGEAQDQPLSPNGPVRHDEFIDQDVKDCLTDAIRKGASFKDSNNHAQCYELFENACQSASSLLPVDSDHRGRLQLSLARAESMSPDRACAILRYAMDDVLRSGMRSHKQPLPDLSKRADVVLSKPKGHPSMTGSSGQVVQSNEEALNSLVEEMKEMMGAPIYKDTPLQNVSKRFFESLTDTQRQQSKSEQRLEQNLGKLKGDFLLARAEWEEKLTVAQEQTEIYKRRAMGLKSGEAPSIMEDARSISQSLHSKTLHEDNQSSSSKFNEFSKHPGVESVVSMGSTLGKHAKSLVGSFACGSGINEPNGQVNNATQAWRDRRAFDKSRYDDNYSSGGGRSFRDV